MKPMKVTAIDGTVFPGLLIGGTLSDSRTGEKAKADKWEEISYGEYYALCDDWGLTDDEENDPCEGRTIWNSDGTDGPCLIC